MAGTTSGRTCRPVRLVALAAIWGLSFLQNFSTIRDAGATTASAVTYLVPVSSIGAGVEGTVGAAIIITGAAVAQGRQRLRSARLAPG
jgi:hypothetical protein